MKMLVFARKYNDIYYAISTEEWNLAECHYLMMITDRLDCKEYPMQAMFDKVFTIHTQGGTVAFVKEILEIKRILNRIDFDMVTISNLAMVENLYVINNKKAKTVLLLEDGIMNYYDFKPSHRLSKVAVMTILGINENGIQKKISKSYLLKPDTAVYYFGQPTQLKLKCDLFVEKAHLDSSLKGKSIFVGQDLYRNHSLTVEEYSEVVNQIIDKYHIDYYLPHTWSLNTEEIKCPHFDIMKSKATLEIYASAYDFTVYSFSSSVLYTTKIINSKVNSIALKHPKIPGLRDGHIIYKFVDKIISF